MILSISSQHNRTTLIKLAAFAFAASVIAVSGVALAQSERQRQLIAERLESPAQVCLEGDACAAASQSAAASSASGERTPESIYKSACITCHLNGIADAPKLEDRTAWQQRLESKGLDQLYASVIKGIGAMPPRGVCIDCSDDDLRKTVDYILSKNEL